MAEVKLRFNLDAEEVELVVDGKVALSTGADVFQSWVSAYNDKHKSVDEPVADKTVDLDSEVPAEEPAEVTVDTDDEA